MNIKVAAFTVSEKSINILLQEIRPRDNGNYRIYAYLGRKVSPKISAQLQLGNVVPTKSDSDVIFCLQLLSKTLTSTLHLSKRESRDHLCINPIHRI